MENEKLLFENENDAVLEQSEKLTKQTIKDNLYERLPESVNLIPTYSSLSLWLGGSNLSLDSGLGLKHANRNYVSIYEGFNDNSTTNIAHVIFKPYVLQFEKHIGAMKEYGRDKEREIKTIGEKTSLRTDGQLLSQKTLDGLVSPIIDKYDSLIIKEGEICENMHHEMLGISNLIEKYNSVLSCATKRDMTKNEYQKLRHLTRKAMRAQQCDIMSRKNEELKYGVN